MAEKIRPLMKEYDSKFFAKKRKILGLSVYDISYLTRLSRETIRNAETGKKPVQPSSILLIGLSLDLIASKYGKLDEFKKLTSSASQPEA